MTSLTAMEYEELGSKYQFPADHVRLSSPTLAEHHGWTVLSRAGDITETAQTRCFRRSARVVAGTEGGHKPARALLPLQ